MNTFSKYFILLSSYHLIFYVGWKIDVIPQSMAPREGPGG